jgi:phenylglyoxylate dehydrogenase gamma subunit
MYEIRMHGRGGQGVVLAATILATALVEEGKYAVAVPSFGFERRGAPVAAFVRADDHEIRQMTNIYRPHCILCLDPTVARTVNIYEGMRPGSTLVQTTNKPLADLKLPPAITTAGLCDAVAIALAIFRRPITNTIMLGALARTTGLVSLGALQAALQTSEFRDAGLAQNLTALQRGYDETTVHRLDSQVAA